MRFPHIPKAVVIGYPTLDYVASTAVPLRGHGTVAARLHTQSDWPRPGGAVLYAAARLALAGHVAIPLIQLGDDTAGDVFVAACQAAGLNVDGIIRAPGTRSPSCILIHHDSGGYSCLLDTDGLATTGLTPGQTAFAAAADLIVIAAGAPKAAEAALAAVQPHQTVAWIVKDDPACFPPYLRERLSRRADLVFHNRSERGLIAGGSGRRIRVETQGADGAVVHAATATTPVPAEPLHVADATGAGDTLAGEFLAHWLGGERDPIAACRAGVAAARALLAKRSD